MAPLVFGVMYLAISIWKPIHHPLQKAIQDNQSPGIAALMILASVVLAPAAEELLFRGVLLGWLSRFALRDHSNAELRSNTFDSSPNPSVRLDVPEEELDFSDLAPLPDHRGGEDFNPWAAPDARVLRSRARMPFLVLANVVVSLVFAALHSLVWPTPIPIFFLSLGLGFLYQRTGGLVAPIALHMTFNGVSTLAMFVSAGVAAPDKPLKPVPLPVPAGISLLRSDEVSSMLRLGDDPPISLIEPDPIVKLIH
ncbi:CPBP family intramembrane glutamic endopeptidase [Tundrisphaera lichenicola]|uniref:CPBP family intramembrane glutamic endopeptidase n=1 Tax=Tundrisphaera lichenicola TaxID=2029860 RepID=UPI003EB6A3E0